MMARDLQVQMDDRGRFGDWKLTATPDTTFLTHSPPPDTEGANETQTKTGFGIQIRLSDGMASLFTQTDKIIPDENHVTHSELLRLPTLAQLVILEEQRRDEQVFSEVQTTVFTHDRREGKIAKTRMPLNLPGGKRVIDDLNPAPIQYQIYFKQATILADQAYKHIIGAGTKG